MLTTYKVTLMSRVQRMVMQSLSHVRFSVTPGTVAHQASLSTDFPSKNMEWVAISFSRRSSPPRDRKLVSCIACRFSID